MVLGESYRARRAQRLFFLRIIDCNVKGLAISEFIFDLIRQIASTHHQAADSLRTELPDQQMKERFLSNRRKHLRCGGQN